MHHIGHDLLLDVLEHPLEVFALLWGLVWKKGREETGLFVLVTSANKTDHHRTGVVGDGKSINFYIGDRGEVVGCNC